MQIILWVNIIQYLSDSRKKTYNLYRNYQRNTCGNVFTTTKINCGTYNVYNIYYIAIPLFYLNTKKLKCTCIIHGANYYIALYKVKTNEIIRIYIINILKMMKQVFGVVITFGVEDT